MDRELRVEDAPVARPDQVAMGNAHRMQPALDIALPELQEAAELGEGRRLVERLPEEGLQQPRMVGHVVEDMGREQAVALELAGKIR